MADNTTLNPGTGGDVIMTEQVGAAKIPVSKIRLGAQDVDGGDVTVTNPFPVEISDGVTVLGTSAHPLRTDPTGTTAQPISAASLPLPTGAATSANQPAPGQAAMAASLPVVIASNQSAVPVSGTVTANIGTGTAAVAGDVAAAATDSGNPVKIGGLAKTSNPTAVTDGQRVAAMFDKLGKQIVVGAIRDLKGVQKTTITSSTSETTIVTAVASTFLDLYGLVIANTSATACNVTIKDATSGTTRAILAVPAGETRGFMMPVDSAIPQAAVNNNWTATCSASVASIEITALVVKNL